MSAIEEAGAWLEDYLNMVGGSKASKLAKAEGFKQGHTERNLQRAASRLNMVVNSEGFPRTTTWTLPAELRRPASGDTSGDVS